MRVSRILVASIVLMAALPAVEVLAARPYLVFDPATGEVLRQNEAGEPWYPASLTKLMTAYIVFGKLKTGGLSLSQDVDVSQEARFQPPSRIDLEPGVRVTVDLAIQAMLVYSANDMAYALAETVSGSADAFVRQMNVEAERLGLSGTHFTNPNGIFDPRQVTTARDMALLASFILKRFPERAHYFEQPVVTVGKRRLANRNTFLTQMPQADGMKTGYVCSSGFNIIATATVSGRKLGAVVFGAANGKQRADKAHELLSEAFAQRSKADGPKLEELPNLRLGTAVPIDLAGSLCPSKPSLKVVSSRRLEGWGIGFGAYSTVEKADMALRGRLLDPAVIDLAGDSGVIRLPGAAGFTPVVWGLGEEQSRTACEVYRRQNAPCTVISPGDFTAIAKLTPDLPPKPRLRPARRS